MRVFPTLKRSYASSGAGRNDARDDIAYAALEAWKNGQTRVRLLLPSDAEKLEIAAQLIDDMRVNTAVVSPNLAAQALWHDKYGHAESRFSDAVSRIWREAPTQAVSALPYSSAPVLLLTSSAIKNGTAGCAADTGKARMLRHLLRRRNRLLILDHAELLPPIWNETARELAEETGALVLEALAGCLPAECRDSADDGGIPVFTQSPAALVRDSRLPPFLSLAHVTSADGRAPMSHPSSNPPGAGHAGALEIIEREFECLRGNLRALILLDDGIPETASGDDAPSMSDAAPASWISLLSHDSLRAARAVLFTGASIISHDDLAAALLSEAGRIASTASWEADIEQARSGRLSEIRGAGADWNSRPYSMLAGEVLSRGLTNCLLVPRSIAEAGWRETPANTVVDCTANTARFFVGQRGSSDDPRIDDRPVVYWNILRVREDGAPERAVRLRESSFPSPAADGVLVHGIEHADPAVADPSRLVENDIASINDRAHARSAARSDIAEMWRIGEPYRNTERSAVLAHCPGFEPRPAETLQRRSMEADLADWLSARAAFRFHNAIGGAAAAGLAMSLFLYLPIEAGGIAAAAVLAAALAMLFVRRRALRLRKPKRMLIRPDEYLSLIADAVLAALDKAGALSPRKPTAARVSSPSEDWYLVSCEGGDDEAAEIFFKSFLEICSDVEPSRPYVTLSTIESDRITLRALARMNTLASLYRPAGVLPIPTALASEPSLRKIFADALTDGLARASVADNTSFPAGPPPAHHIPIRSARRSVIWE